MTTQKLPEIQDILSQPPDESEEKSSKQQNQQELNTLISPQTEQPAALSNAFYPQIQPHQQQHQSVEE